MLQQHGVEKLPDLQNRTRKTEDILKATTNNIIENWFMEE